MPVIVTVQVAGKHRRRNRRSRRKASGVNAKMDPSTAMAAPAKAEHPEVVASQPTGNTTNAKEPMKAFMEKFEDQMLGDYLLSQFELAVKGDLGGAMKLQRRCGGYPRSPPENPSRLPPEILFQQGCNPNVILLHSWPTGTAQISAIGFLDRPPEGRGVRLIFHLRLRCLRLRPSRPRRPRTCRPDGSSGVPRQKCSRFLNPKGVQLEPRPGRKVCDLCLSKDSAYKRQSCGAAPEEPPAKRRDDKAPVLTTGGGFWPGRGPAAGPAASASTWHKPSCTRVQGQNSLSKLADVEAIAQSFFGWRWLGEGVDDSSDGWEKGSL
ncbi:hypothetical protein FN846DRAFT_893421 [Sphaerosporella brunnea]|uniref:Uncharacterized protein n=1 Tax=Sphaerosporella brunnea TaxID=1250544 RepID=A0A5J5EM86_9PEZI|nr:hypothetical protein FN846DRAFT_893421 [Sphaerosporella brunnea]